MQILKLIKSRSLDYKKGGKLIFLPFFLFAISCAGNSSKYGRVTLHNTADKNSFVFSASEEFTKVNVASPKDKKFPKWGGPGGVFVKIKDKCKKFPYCNQGINAIEILREIDGMDDLINENAKKYGLSIKEVENLLSKEIKQIFI